MKRIYLFLAAAAMLLTTACSNDDAANGVALDSQTTAANLAVGFDTYTANATRAGQAEVMNTTQLKATGFGVFAVQSPNTTYAATQKTDFMWNQKVEWSANSWTYSPLKYWPNETNTDSQTPAAAAESSHTDRLSFFAYAPYVEQVSTDGSLKDVTYGTAPNDKPTTSAHNSTSTGIVGVSANDNETTDPYVWYVVSDKPSESVDLLWGVAPAGGLSYETVYPNYKSAGVATLEVDEGLPLIDLIKPNKDQKMKFLFKHALARIGLSVVAAVDQISAGGTLGTGTKIAVEKVKITEATATKKLHKSGRLNLNNNTANQANWMGLDAATVEFTVDASNELSDEIKWVTDVASTVEKPAFVGVDNQEKKVIRKGGDKTKDEEYFMVIPTHEDTDLNVEITYHVFTADPKVAGGYAVTDNVINKTVTIPNLTNNKSYNLKLILGLTSVKLDAEVADWQLEGDTDVDLPRNNE